MEGTSGARNFSSRPGHTWSSSMVECLYLHSALPDEVHCWRLFLHHLHTACFGLNYQAEPLAANLQIFQRYCVVVSMPLAKLYRYSVMRMALSKNWTKEKQRLEHTTFQTYGHGNRQQSKHAHKNLPVGLHFLGIQNSHVRHVWHADRVA